jgi:predicted secreted protein
MSMPIGPVTIVAIYLIVWWTVLFCVLPLGMNQQDQKPPTDGAQWGAPDKPDLKRKFITTTWLAAVVWAVIMLVIFTGWLPLPNVGAA